MLTVVQDGWVGMTRSGGGVRLIVGVTEAGEQAVAHKQRSNSDEVFFSMKLILNRQLQFLEGRHLPDGVNEVCQ